MRANYSVKRCLLLSLLLFSYELHSAVFYYPIGRWPYIERNISNIRTLCHDIWDVDERDLLILKSIVNKGVVKDTFNSHAVRVVIEFLDKDVYIDDNGVASTDLRNGLIVDVNKIKYFHESLSQDKIRKCNIY